MKQLTNEMLSCYSNNELKCLRNNISDYIVPLDKVGIEWKVFNYFEMSQFINDNYLNNGEYIWWLECNEKTLLGMTFLPFPPYNEKLKFLVGTIKNKLNKETMIGCIAYSDCLDLGEDYNKLTFIETVEINYFYQELGLLKIMLNEFCKMIDKEQNIIITFETHKGRLCHVMDYLKYYLNQSEFKKDLRFSHEITEDYVKSMIKK